jgi:N-acyl-D-aspartate/D-glutamate deacylase
VHFDTIIRHGRVVDGTGSPAVRADVGIAGDRIAAVDKLDGATATEVIDATGSVVAPGFVDVHVHSELALLGGPHRYGAVSQGVTTHLLAPDGFGWAPLPSGPARELWDYTRFAYGEAPVIPDLPIHRTLTAAREAGERAVFVATQTGRYIGMSVDEAAAAVDEPLGDFALRILDEEDPYALMVYHRSGPLERHAAIARDTLRHPRMMVASDGVYHGPSGHPRGYGCFARILRSSVRETAAISLEEAVWKMSGFPAERFRITDRGLLRPGYGADVVIFDPESVADRATWDDPFCPAVGIERVIVNGATVVRQGQPTGVLPGRSTRPRA